VLKPDAVKGLVRVSMGKPDPNCADQVNRVAAKQDRHQ
jgi:hypothetical protein